ncbi:beta-N-acetylhexosaminidase [Actinocorallia sp. A-T 12471]|uniref:beta-N-acetylhexosaminidase n=1 Tax=Actinocorallia sp. A-T 12471 TaxID=3089813 RepID=UPI0029D11500|nr:beta-N-acetylhexosaminidase [Actinocorallia sp. A-T 12471]MDX6739521.1 beta-N-acetylhexosaminidase [Actinocorallia sp. A-T 12471]
MINLVPLPGELRELPGSLALDGVTVTGDARTAGLLTGYFGHGPTPVRLTLDPAIPDGDGYRLAVGPSGIEVTAARRSGLAFGVQTLRQLRTDNGRVPHVEITDTPRYAWRGALLDVARHHMPLEFLYRFVDQLAFHKLNVLHLHLTDDQGWRIEIDGYPRLTEVGAWRTESMVGRAGSTAFDGTPHGGYYTQAELAELVAFADVRGVRIVPEIEMPGHAMAALAAYPELGNDAARPLPVWTGWGISEHVFGVQDETLEFCREVLRQVMKVFPSRDIHLGGDECPTRQWENSAAARERAASLGLARPAELHGWFLGEIAGFLAEHGRRAVCWDEAAHSASPPPPGAAVMAWRDPVHAADAAARGHEVIMTPYRWTYLDYPQTGSPHEPLGQEGAIITLADVYRFEPGPVLGAQAQLWTEFAATPAEVEYLAYPRLCALAETAWSDLPKDFAGFTARLRPHLARLGVAHGEVPA